MDDGGQHTVSRRCLRRCKRSRSVIHVAVIRKPISGYRDIFGIGAGIANFCAHFVLNWSYDALFGAEARGVHVVNRWAPTVRLSLVVSNPANLRQVNNRLTYE